MVVPFQTRVLLGYVVETMESSDVAQTRAVIGRYSPGDVPVERVELARWMAQRWYTTLAVCLRMMTPPAMRGRIVRRVRTVEGSSAHLPPKIAQILEFIHAEQPVSHARLYRRFGKEPARRALSILRKANLIEEDIEVSSGGAAAQTEKAYSAADDLTVAQWLETHGRRRFAQAALLRRIADCEGPVLVTELGNTTSNISALLRQLTSSGVVTVEQRPVRRRAREMSAPRKLLELTQDQGRALDQIEAALRSEEFREILLFGVTASGKTEVYLRAIQRVLEEGRSALVLMPEIALTVHAISQFRAWFGDELAVLHSRLSVGERADEWRRIQAGEARVVLGPRSAVFAPLVEPRIIIIDEEHEGAFKQDSDPRYHARELCRHIATRLKIPLILGSATPSLETFYRAQNGSAELCEMASRIDSRPMPEVQVVDMREFAREGHLTILSDPLRQALSQAVSDHGQTILFLNRRAYGTFVMCRECGYVASCPNCAVSTKYHRIDRSIRCHHCDFKAPAPSICPSCQSVKIASFGVGTQRVEEELALVNPKLRVMRMDRDTTSGKDAVVNLLERFRAHEADVLVGTQMVAKGLDFPGVLLVGVINADSGLHMPDYRAAERGFQLLTQVAGRAGRGERAGKVVLQTFQPGHYAITAAVHHDFRSFYDHELLFRQELGWPPFGAVARLLIRDNTQPACQRAAREIAHILGQVNTPGKVEILGPSPAPIERIYGKFRFNILLRAPEREDILNLLDRSEARNWKSEVAIDIDALNMM
ncbi:MAG: primosomal protein N' [Armatimonadetes bacterium]|nr:primosomal protein N' [Armatimonadota bacterium]